jgi:Histidine kinase-, DNA gyrase B-, and HSP90-like ATPase
MLLPLKLPDDCQASLSESNRNRVYGWDGGIDLTVRLILAGCRPSTGLPTSKYSRGPQHSRRNMQSVSLVNDGAALQSMRSSDFDAYSAMGEVIDNAIQAQAKNVSIQIEYTSAKNNKGSEPITAVYFGDDGAGMPTEVLHQCLQLGYSTRYNDRSGIGRFGVGATLAAINQCKKIELYSKQKGGSWQYTFIDLDLVTAKPSKMKEIPAPVKKDPPSVATQLVGKDHGTLVIWSKYDRQEVGAIELLDELRIWIGRTYRRFIWEGSQIKVNGETTKAIDPLYVTTKLTRFPDDPTAHEYKTIKLSWPVAPEDRASDGPSESVIKIRMSLLPKEFRPNQGSGNLKGHRDRYIYLNEGVSILRNGREVFYNHIPWWPGDPFKEIDRWWGCEISFDAILDSAFTVKNIKRGAVPVKALKKAIHDAISPTRNTALEAVRELWVAAVAKAKVKDAEAGLDTGHGDAEKAAKGTPTPKSAIDEGKDLDEEVRKVADEYLKGADDQKKAQWHAKFKNQPFTILEDEWKGPEFVETNHLGGSDVLKYNRRHVFFSEIDAIKEVLAEDEKELKYAGRLAALIDLLLIAYSKAEAMFDREMQLTAEQFIEQLRMNWGHYLTSYITTWKQQEKSSDGEE